MSNSDFPTCSTPGCNALVTAERNGDGACDVACARVRNMVRREREVLAKAKQSGLTRRADEARRSVELLEIAAEAVSRYTTHRNARIAEAERRKRQRERLTSGALSAPQERRSGLPVSLPV